MISELEWIIFTTHSTSSWETSKDRIDSETEKCQFGKAHCKFLDLIVGSGVVQPELDKLNAVKESSSKI